MGALTACVAFIVDVCVATVADWKFGYCKRNPFLNREACCTRRPPILQSPRPAGEVCTDFKEWSNDPWKSFAIYLGLALAYGVISATATLTTKRSLPAAAPAVGDKPQSTDGTNKQPVAQGKTLYFAAGAGIGEIKTILSGFVIPGFLDFNVLFVKAFGAIFAVATSMNLGKEGPFVHISGCVAYLVAIRFPKYRENGRKLREMLSAGVASGLSVAFGAPIGGVLFSYEEISTYFPRKVLWRAFLCSLSAATVLKALNPTGTGKLVLFETGYGTKYSPEHYFVFVILGIAGGVWGGIFCKLNFIWSKFFRKFGLIKNYPVFEVFLVVLVTVLLQYPNPLIREPGDIVIKNLLVNCQGASPDVATSWVCENEKRTDDKGDYIAWLASGSAIKLILTIITFGAKVPSGVIIPALDGGALFGRLIGQFVGGLSPGIFAMVGAAAFLAGVSRMTISLVVIMFELTGELEYILPNMIAILVAKWVADMLGRESVYDLAQNVLGHPFLDVDVQLLNVKAQNPPHLVERLIPPKETMDQITVHIEKDNKVPRSLLQQKLDQMVSRGLMDAGLVLLQDGIIQGYLGEAELAFGLNELGKLYPSDVRVRLLGEHIDDVDPLGDGHTDAYNDEEYQRELLRRTTSQRNAIKNYKTNHMTTVDALSESSSNDSSAESGDLDLTMFVDRTPMLLIDTSPMEYAVEMFGRLGLRHLMIVEEGTGKLRGVCLKKRLVGYLESLEH